MLKVKPGRGALRPQLGGLLGRRRVVGRVDLDQRELLGVVGQPLLGGVGRRRVPARLQQRPVGPRGGADLDRHPWAPARGFGTGPAPAHGSGPPASGSAARRSRVCLQVTQVVADGKISSRSTGIGPSSPRSCRRCRRRAAACACSDWVRRSRMVRSSDWAASRSAVLDAAVGLVVAGGVTDLDQPQHLALGDGLLVLGGQLVVAGLQGDPDLVDLRLRPVPVMTVSWTSIRPLPLRLSHRRDPPAGSVACAPVGSLLSRASTPNPVAADQ